MSNISNRSIISRLGKFWRYLLEEISFQVAALVQKIQILCYFCEEGSAWYKQKQARGNMLTEVHHLADLNRESNEVFALSCNNRVVV